jgi:hypothetical protein
VRLGAANAVCRCRACQRPALITHCVWRPAWRAGEADGFPDDVGSEPPELPAPPPPPVAAAASAPQPVPAPVVAAGGDSGSGAAAAAAVAAAAAAAQQLQQQQQAPSVGSAPEQSHPSSVARPGSVHTRTLSFDAGTGWPPAIKGRVPPGTLVEKTLTWGRFPD